MIGSPVGRFSMRRSARRVHWIRAIRGHGGPRGVSIFGILGSIPLGARRFRKRPARERSGRRRGSIAQFLPNIGSIVVQLVRGIASRRLGFAIPHRVNAVNRGSRAGRKFEEIGVIRVQSRAGAGPGEAVEHHVLGRVSWPTKLDRRVRIIRIVESVGDVRATGVKVCQRMDGGYGFGRGHVDGDVQQSVGDIHLLRLFLSSLLVEGRIHPYVGSVNGVVHEHGGIDGVILHDYGKIVGRVERFLHHDPILLMDARLRRIQIVVRCYCSLRDASRRARRGNALLRRCYTGRGDSLLYSIQYPPFSEGGILYGGLLRPRLQVESVNEGIVAGQRLILQGVSRQEHERLNGLDIVHRDAEDLGQGDASDLLKLSSRETVLLSRILVPESIAPTKVIELLTDYTGERGPHQTALHRFLRNPAGEQIDILHRRIHRSELARGGRWDRFVQVVEVSYGGQGAGFSPVDVGGDTVIPSSLDVDGGQIHPEGEARGLEQVIGQFFAYVLVPSLGGLVDQAEKKAIHGSRCLQIAEICQLVVNRDIWKSHVQFHLFSIKISSFAPFHPTRRNTDC